MSQQVIQNQMGQEEELNLTDLLRVALSHVRLILAVTFACVGLGLAYAFFWPKTYEAAVTVKVPDASQTTMGMLREISPNAGGDPVETYLEICKSDTVAAKVAESLGLSTHPDYAGLSRQGLLQGLGSSIQITNVRKSNVLSIRAQSKDPKMAADLANAWAESFIAVNLDLSRQGAASKRKFIEEQVTLIKKKLDSPGLRLSQETKADEVVYNLLLQKLQEARIEENVDASGIVVLDTALPPEKPISPKKRRAAMLSLLLGLALGVQLAFLLDRLRDRVKHEDTLKQVTGLPNYAVVPDFREDYPEGMGLPDPKERFTPKALIQNPVFAHAYYKESFKTLRTNLTFAQADRPLKVMAVLSPGPEEGKTLVNANLAISLAETGKRTLLVDADLRKSSVRKIFGLEARTETGLPLALTGQKEWRRMIRPSGIENLQLLPNSITPPNPAELLGSSAMRKLIEELKDEYEFIVFDGAPILPVTDSVVLSTHLDAVVLLTRWDKTKTRETAKALENLKAVGAPVVGTLMNHVKMRRGLYGYGYGGYSYGYKYAAEEKEKAGKG